MHTERAFTPLLRTDPSPSSSRTSAFHIPRLQLLYSPLPHHLTLAVIGPRAPISLWPPRCCRSPPPTSLDFALLAAACQTTLSIAISAASAAASLAHILHPFPLLAGTKDEENSTTPFLSPIAAFLCTLAVATFTDATAHRRHRSNVAHRPTAREEELHRNPHITVHKPHNL